MFSPFWFYKRYYFFINSYGPYSNFVGTDLEYHNSLVDYDKSSWSEIPQLWATFETMRRRPQDLDRSQILVTLGGSESFSKRFLSFEILHLWASVCVIIFTVVYNMTYFYKITVRVYYLISSWTFNVL